MSPADFEDIAALWQKEPTPEEELAFRTLALRASRRARWVDRAERGFALLFVAGVLIALLLASRPATVVIGIITAAAIAWSSWKRHLLNQVKAMVGEGDRRTFIDTAVALAGARLRRSAIGLWLLLPGILLGGLLGESLRKELDLRDFAQTLLNGLMRWPVGPLAGLVILLTLAFLIRTHRRLAVEYKRLKAVQADYEREEKLDAAPSP